MLCDHALTMEVKQGHFSNRESVGISLKVVECHALGEGVQFETSQTQAVCILVHKYQDCVDDSADAWS